MKLTVAHKQSAPSDSTRYRNRYLDEIIECGGESLTRSEVGEAMRQEGTPQPLIDRWLQGQEIAARIRARRERLATTMVLAYSGEKP